MGERRAEQREDAIAGGLHDVAVIAMRRIDHQPDRRIDDRPGLLGIEVLHQIHRTLDVREQRGDRLALALDRRRSVWLLRRDADIGSRRCSLR
jgi:hypothetical protein